MYTPQTISWHSFSAIFGSQSYATKIFPWAANVDVELQSPEANICGVAHIGTISVSSLSPGVSLATLRQFAFKRIDLKHKRTLGIRASIVNDNMIHWPIPAGVPVGPTDDEMISYIIFENPARSITNAASANLISYSLTMGIYANLAWWPDGTQPLLNGITDAQIDVIEPGMIKGSVNPRHQANCKALKALRAQPTIPDHLEHIVRALHQGKDITTMVQVEAQAFSAAPTPLEISDGLHNDVAPDLFVLLTSPVLHDDRMFLEWESRKEPCILHTDYWTPEMQLLWDEMSDIRDELLDSMKKEEEKREAFHQRIQQSRQEVSWHRGRSTVKWFDSDGNEIDWNSAAESILGFSPPQSEDEEDEPPVPVIRPDNPNLTRFPDGEDPLSLLQQPRLLKSSKISERSRVSSAFQSVKDHKPS